MALTQEDLRDFNRFADEKLANGGAESLVELAGEWEAQRRVREITVDVEVDAKTARYLAEAFPDEHDLHKLQQALARRGGVTTAEMLSKAAAAAEKANQG